MASAIADSMTGDGDDDDDDADSSDDDEGGTDAEDVASNALKADLARLVEVAFELIEKIEEIRGHLLDFLDKLKSQRQSGRPSNKWQSALRNIELASSKSDRVAPFAPVAPSWDEETHQYLVTPAELTAPALLTTVEKHLLEPLFVEAAQKVKEMVEAMRERAQPAFAAFAQLEEALLNHLKAKMREEADARVSKAMVSLSQTVLGDEEAPLVQPDVSAVLEELFQRLRSCLERSIQGQVKELIFGGVKGCAKGASWSQLLRATEGFERALSAKLGGKATQLMAKYGQGSSLRDKLFSAALRTASTYSINVGGESTGLGLLAKAWSFSRKQLTKDCNEMTYLLTKLEKLEELSVMSETWRDVAETWLSVIALRRQMISPLVLTILDSVVEDEKVLDALGMAEALISTVGQPPRELLTRLNQGPGAHIRKHAYEYSRSINAEIALIDRIRDARGQSHSQWSSRRRLAR